MGDLEGLTDWESLVDIQTLHRNDVLRGSSRVPAPRPNLHRDYSKSLTLSNLGEPSKVEFLRTIPKFRNKGKFRRCLCISSVHGEIGHFHVVVVQCRQRNKQKSVMHVENCCFRLIPSFRLLSSDVKVLACENIRFSSLFVAEDVSRETSTATKSEEKRMFSQAIKEQLSGKLPLFFKFSMVS